ncbi:Bacterial Ig-like domain (group 2) [compost metagenome]
MQTVIKSQYDAGKPGDLVVLPSFKSAATVESCRAGAAVFPGDAVKLVDGNDSSVVPLEDTDDVTVAYGVAVSAHSNMPAMPSFGNNDTAYGVSANVPQGVVTNGPICVAVKSGEAPNKKALAKPLGRNATTGFMEWGVAATGQSRFRFDSGVLNGGVAYIVVVDGALLGKADAPVVGVTGVTVAPTTASLAPGATQQLTATVTPANATDKSGAWSSDDEAVATVSTTGLITVKASATAASTASITFTTTDGGKTAACAVTVSGS